ncbi:MAG: thiol-disulfide oxidoreductase DCC family protein [Acidobacteriaceae bacterium]
MAEDTRLPMTENQQNPVWFGKSIVLYDGVCGLCNHFVRFVIEHDRSGQFYFAPLESPFAQEILARHGLGGSSLDTVVLVTAAETGQETLLFRSDAAAAICGQIGGFWSALARLTCWFPQELRDVGYRLVARYRYRIFGRFETCPLPKPEWQKRFLGGED